MTKNILFVTYGGGHARMITPVLHELDKRSDINYHLLALTIGGPIVKSCGYDFLGFKDFLTPEDTEALAWGKKLAKDHHVPESGITEEEAIAYLGLCYWDLVCRHGEEEAARLWNEQGRHAFLPISVLERIITKLQSDLVVTTNSPKSEHAAIEAANKLGVASLSMVDLFGIYHFHKMTAQHIAVLSEKTIDNMIAEGVTRPRDAFYVVGNPAFDLAFDYRGPIDTDFRKAYIPNMPPDAKTLMWADMPAYWNLTTKVMHVRSDEEVLHDLDILADVTAKEDAHLLIRPHPSQPHAIYEQWMNKMQHKHVHFVGSTPLYPLLKASDVIISYGSTVTVEALLMQRRVIQIKYYDDFSDLPIGEWGLCWLAQDHADIQRCVHESFYDETIAAQMAARVQELLPHERSAPRILQLIEEILQQPKPVHALSATSH